MKLLFRLRKHVSFPFIAELKYIENYNLIKKQIKNTKWECKKGVQNLSPILHSLS